MTEVRIDGAATKLAAAGVPIARAEGFEVHAESMQARAGAGALGSGSAAGRLDTGAAGGAAVSENEPP
jgi:hypothetical protein